MCLLLSRARWHKVVDYVVLILQIQNNIKGLSVYVGKDVIRT